MTPILAGRLGHGRGPPVQALIARSTRVLPTAQRALVTRALHHERANLNAAAALSVPREVKLGSSVPSGSESQSQTSYEHHGTWNARWFSKAVEDIVRRLDGSPSSDQFTHVVQVGRTEAVILVKKIVRRIDLDTHHITQVAKCGGAENRNTLLALAMERVDGGDVGVERGASLGPRMSPEQDQVEHVCQELLQASRARYLVNSGRVGDCCDVVDVKEASKGGDGAVGQRDALNAHPPKAFHGFWGVVVQTKERSSVEGCYLLKAGCSVVESGCSCTHYTLTRVEEPSGCLGGQGAGEIHPEYVPPVADQFVESWRTRRGGW